MLRSVLFFENSGRRVRIPAVGRPKDVERHQLWVFLSLVGVPRTFLNFNAKSYILVQ